MGLRVNWNIFAAWKSRTVFLRKALKVLWGLILPVGAFNAAVYKLISTVPNLVSAPTAGCSRPVELRVPNTTEKKL